MNILWIFGSSWLVWFYVFPGILGDNCLILGTVDSYGHLIVSRLDIMTDGHPIQYHLVIVVLGKAVGLGYALAQLSDPWQPLLTSYARVLTSTIRTFMFAVCARYGIHLHLALFNARHM